MRGVPSEATATNWSPPLRQIRQPRVARSAQATSIVGHATTTKWTAALRQYRPLAGVTPNGSNRPRAPLRRYSHERAVCAALRSKAERGRRARDLPAYGRPSRDSDRACNKRIRDLSGFEEPLPAVGDRLVCLRNDRTKGLVGRLVAGRGARLRAEGLRPHGRALGGRGGGEVGQVAVLKAFFEGTEGDLAYAIRREPTSSTTAMR